MDCILEAETTLLVGFDSAWTAANSGALAGALYRADGSIQELGPPIVADFKEAESIIQQWQAAHKVSRSIVLLDQPTIVVNRTGQRPVENIVCSAISARYGGMQPASTSRIEMFGADAPLWRFLDRFGGPANPGKVLLGTSVFETYPVLMLIALGWTLPDSRPGGRLPKYNPDRRKTFSLADWQHVCKNAADTFAILQLQALQVWLEEVGASTKPRKQDQDGLDACLCLLVALVYARRQGCLMVGDVQSGYILVPSSIPLRAEMEARCMRTGRNPTAWIRMV